MVHKYWLVVFDNIKQMHAQQRDDLERKMLRLINSVYCGDNDGVSECLAKIFKVDFSVCLNTIDGSHQGPLGSHRLFDYGKTVCHVPGGFRSARHGVV